jgi:FAD/FMN-containing dehydrogenase
MRIVSPVSGSDWGALQEDIAGDVVVRGSPGYDLRRKPSNALFHDVRPQAVVLCRSPTDVRDTILFARRFGLHAAVRGGGHCMAGHSSTEGVVIDVTPMDSVSVSGAVATVGAGMRLGGMNDALAEHSLTIPAGSGPSVGIAGLTLGGGLGILGRRHGLTADQLLGAEVVLADGRIVQCDDRHGPELFWALRGAGGGNFGVVTSLIFNTVKAPAITCFHASWPHTEAAAAISAWQAWAPNAPDELAATLLVTAAGEVGEPLTVELFGGMVGGEADTDTLLDEMFARTGADPRSAFRRQMPYREAKHYLTELGGQLEGAGHSLPPERVHAYSRSEFFRRPLPIDAITTLVEDLSAGRAPGQIRELAFLPWGGAYNRVRPDATAFVHRRELFLLKHALMIDSTTPRLERDAARQWLARSWELVHPWGSGGVYPNFPDPDLKDWAHAYYGSNYDRLVRTKRRYDPDNFFAFRHSLPTNPAQ